MHPLLSLSFVRSFLPMSICVLRVLCEETIVGLVSPDNHRESRSK